MLLYGAEINKAFSESSPHFDPTIHVLEAESRLTAEHNVLPLVQIQAHMLPTPAQIGLTVKNSQDSHGRPPVSSMKLFWSVWAESCQAYCWAKFDSKPAEDFLQDEENVFLGCHLPLTPTLQSVSYIPCDMELSLQFEDGTRAHSK